VEAGGRRALLIPGDVQQSKFCVDAVERTVEAFGRLDIVVNNAAYQQHQESIEDITDEQLDRTFRTNIYGYFYMTRAALPHLRAGATIINTGSIAGLEVSTQLLDYSATKGAIQVATFGADTPMKRPAQPEEIAPAFVFFASNPDSSYITGEVLTLLGGDTTAA
jgi:NAD(P)-dependent dehydrogenase (short-subunit alcohol dehydrogenase family)